MTMRSRLIVMLGGVTPTTTPAATSETEILLAPLTTQITRAWRAEDRSNKWAFGLAIVGAVFVVAALTLSIPPLGAASSCDTVTTTTYDEAAKKQTTVHEETCTALTRLGSQAALGLLGLALLAPQLLRSLPRGSSFKLFGAEASGAATSMFSESDAEGLAVILARAAGTGHNRDA